MFSGFWFAVRSSGLGMLLLAASLSAFASEADKPRPVIDVHLHAHPLAMFEQLIGPPPIPHCVPMTDYPAPGPGRSWRSVKNQDTHDFFAEIDEIRHRESVTDDL